MPELPEVETVRRTLIADGLIGLRVQTARVGWDRSVGGSAETFRCAIEGARFVGLDRRGKYLIADMEVHGADGRRYLVMHLRMSGRLYLCDATQRESGYERVVIKLDDGREMRFHDPRKFGRMTVERSRQSIDARLGVEPLSTTFTREHLVASLSGRRGAIKPFLLAQYPIAGLGNIYADEALFEAGIHPLRQAGSLSAAESVALHAAIRSVLQRGIDNLGTALGHGLGNFVLPTRARNQEDIRVFRRTGEPCVVCGERIARIVVGQRGTHFCPQCQPEATIRT